MSTATQMVNNATQMVNMANSLESANTGMSNSVHTTTNAMSQVANKMLNSATVVNNAVVSANSVIEVANSTPAKIVNVALNSSSSEVADAVVNAANKLNSSVSNARANAMLVNAAVNAAANVEIKETNKVISANKQLMTMMNNSKSKISPQNPLKATYAQVVAMNSKNLKKLLHTTEGNVKPILKANGKNVIHINGSLRPVTPNHKKIKMVKHNNKSTPTGKKIFKQGEMRKIYKNNKGSYTVMGGVYGNMKNYLFKGANGLFSGSML